MPITVAPKLDPANPVAPSVVFLIDDDDSVRRSLQRLLSLQGLQVETFSSPQAMLARLPYEGDGCIVTDLRMPEMSGIELQKAALAKGCPLPFVFITGHGEVQHAVEAMKDGALDFLEKPLDPATLLNAVRGAIASRQKTRALEGEQQNARALLQALSPRELQVCELVGKGLLNKQIAAELGTSEKTVKAQRGSATRKLNVHSTAELVHLLRKAAF